MKLSDYEYYRTDLGVLYCGDCLEVLPLLKCEECDGSGDTPSNTIDCDIQTCQKCNGDGDIFADLILTDPPYNASNSNIGFKDGYKTIDEDWDKNFDPLPVLDVSFDKLKVNGSLLVFCSYHLLGDYLKYGKEKMQQIIHWEHIVCMPAIAKVYTPAIEYCVWYSRPRYTFNKEFSKRNIIRCHKANINSGKLEHPSVKPYELINELLRVHSNKNDLILDPFLGSGTTAVACEKLGRRWIGIEISEKYCEIAKHRIEDEARQIKMF